MFVIDEVERRKLYLFDAETERFEWIALEKRE
jgi:hypothetical protein